MAQVTNSTNIDNSSLPSSSKVENEGANSNGKLSASEFNNLIQIVSSLVSGHNLQVSELSELRSGKQDKLVSGTNIKTINGQSVLGSGNISVQSGSSSASGISINTISGLTASNVQTALEQIYAKAKESGLTDSQIASAIATYLTNHPIEGVTEAPKDGKQYARKDGAWSEVQSVGLGIKVQSDWNETDTLKASYIKNKPTIISSSRADEIESKLEDIEALVSSQTTVRVQLDSTKNFIIGRNDTSCVIKFTPQVYNGSDKEEGALPITITLKVINENGEVFTSINSYTNIQQSINILSSTYSTLKNHLMSGQNTILVTATYNGVSGSNSFVATYTLLTFSCAHDWSKAWIQGETFGISNIHFSGNIAKVLHVSIDDVEVPSVSFTAVQNYSDAFYTFDLTNYFTQYAKTTGVHAVSVFITTGGTELYRVSYNIMCVISGAKDTAKLVCINNVNPNAVNGKSYSDEDPLFMYATYGTTQVAFHVTAEDNVNSYSVDEQTRSVVAETQYKYTPSLNISSAVDSGLKMTAVLTAGASFNQSVTWNNVDNTNTFAATSGAVFYMNTQNRDNAESEANRVKVKNEGDMKVKDEYVSTWQNFSFGQRDGWTVDDENNRCLAVRAGSLFSINDWTPLNLTSTGSLSLELKIKVQNIADYDTPILTIMDTTTYQQGVSKGVIIFPTKVLVLGSGNNNLNAQMVPLHEDEREDIFIVWQRGYRDVSYNLCRIYVNGVQNAVFEYSGTTTFGTGHLVAGQSNADLFIYGIREYDTALEHQAIKNNFLAGFIDSATNEKYTKNYIKQQNNLIAGDTIDYATAKARGYNCMVIEMKSGNLPYFYDQTGGTCDVKFEWGEDSTNDVTIENTPIEGQGSTSSKYFRWNFRWKCADATTWRYKDNTTTTKKGKLFGSDFPSINKVTAKKNVASSQQGHKMGATSLYNDLYKLCVDGSDVPSSARVAVWQKPVLGFEKIGDTYTFIGHYTVGPDKGDKDTFGYKESSFPDCLSLEGPNHTPRATRFLAPWKSNTQYNVSEEDLYFDNQQGWDVDYVGDSADASALLTSEWKPAYNAVFNSSQYIAPLADSGYSTLEALNAVNSSTFQSGKTNGTPNEYMSFYDTNYDLICFNYQTDKYEVVSGYNLKTILGLTGSPTLAQIKTARQEYFKTNVPTYFNKDSLLFVKAFHILFAVSDNDAKNSYPFKMKSLASGGKWEWREDDLDTLLPTDNNGNSTKKYSVETTDVNDEGSLIFQGSESVLWRMVEDVWADDLRTMMRKIVTAMQTIASQKGITASSIPDTMYNVVEWYFWSHSAQYFPMVTYNEDALYTYITPWYLNKQQPAKYAALYNSNVAPLTQALGDQLAAEKQFVMLRLAYVQSKFLCGGFANGSNAYGSIAMTTATSFQFKLTPAIDLYPAYNIGAGASSSGENHSLGLAKAGNVVSFNSPASSNTTFYIEGTDWLSDLGDLSGLVITNRGGSTGSMAMDITGKRLTKVKFGDTDATKVKFNATFLTIAGSCIKTIEGRNASAVSGTLNLANCPRLEEARFEGTSLQSVMPPMSSRMSTIGLPSSLNTVFFHTLPNMQKIYWESTDRSKIAYIYIQDTPDINPIAILRSAYNSTGSALRAVTMIWSNSVSGTKDDLKMFLAMAKNPFVVATQQGYGSLAFDAQSMTVSAQAGKANIQGTINVSTRIFADDYAALTSAFSALTVNVTAHNLVACTFVDNIVKAKFENLGQYALEGTRYSTYEASLVRSIDMTGENVKVFTDFNNYFTGLNTLTLKNCSLLTGDANITNISSLQSLDLSGTDTRNVTGVENKSMLNEICYHKPTKMKIKNCTKLDVDNVVYSENVIVDGNELSDIVLNANEANIHADGLKVNGDYYINGLEVLEDKGIEVTGTGTAYVNIADQEVMRVLNANGVGSDGKITKAQAESVTNIGTWFKNNTTIKSFNEFRYLKNVTIYNFFGCTNLTEIYIPNIITSIDSSAFADCKSLIYIYMPDAITNIQAGAFARCSKLNIDKLPSCLTTLGDQAFAYCSALSISELPDALITIGNTCFNSCNLKIKKIPNNVTSIGSAAFQSNKNITEIEIGANTTSIGSQAFNNTGLNVLIIHGAIGSISSNLCANVGNCKVKLTNENSVISISQTSMYGASLTWYVPDSLYDSYKTTENWSTWYSNGRLKKISEWVD